MGMPGYYRGAMRHQWNVAFQSFLNIGVGVIPSALQACTHRSWHCQCAHFDASVAVAKGAQLLPDCNYGKIMLQSIKNWNWNSDCSCYWSSHWNRVWKRNQMRE
ncbi:hypothetical protein XENTR_v10025003 [Xenopus tropicalis]|nr:hypothetical protein XENTR_v10025003 [Xenopus tropicalis]